MGTDIRVENVTEGRIQYLDVLRVLAMFAVVFLHTSANTLLEADGSPVWHFSNVITSLFGARVPLFFMISGALLLDSAKTLSVAYTMRHRVLRLVVPLLAWSMIYVAYPLIEAWVVGGSLDWATAIDKLQHLLGDPVIVPLWFMYAMIAAYILSPLLKHLVDDLPKTLIIYLISIWGLFSILLPTIAALVPESFKPLFTMHTKYNLDLLAGYLGYFVIGYYLMKMERPIRKIWLTLTILLDTVVIALGTWWEVGSIGPWSEIFKKHTHIFTAIMTCAVFLLFKELLRGRRLGSVTARVVAFLAPLTFGVYLSHSLMIRLITEWRPMDSIGLLVAYFLAVLGSSVLLVALLSAVKPLSYAFVGRRYKTWWRPNRSAGEEGGDLKKGAS